MKTYIKIALNRFKQVEGCRRERERYGRRSTCCCLCVDEDNDADAQTYQFKND